MAKSGLRHINVGNELTKTEWESEDTHELIHGTSFPGSPVERQLFYRDDEHKWYIYNGTDWVWLGGGGGGGMEVHGNEYHDPDFASEADLAAHEAAATGVHGVGAGTIAKVADIAVDGNLSAAAQDAIAKKHSQLCEAADFTKLDGIEAGADVTANHDPKAHKASHENGGGDEISVAGLSGELADPQPSNLLKLSDTPASYSGQSGKYPRVKATEDGLEFAAAGGGIKIEDADQDTKVNVEESADEDKVRMDVAGVEAFLLSSAGELTLPKQSSVYVTADDTAQSIPNNTETTVEFNTEVTDVQNEFNTGTYTFTAAEAGKYFIAAKISWDSLPNGTVFYVALKRNSTYLASFYSIPGATERISGVAFGVVELAANDAVHAVCWQNSGGSEDLKPDTNCQLYISKLA
jgi:hypothetical protein